MKKILVKIKLREAKLPLTFLKRALQRVLKHWAWRQVVHLSPFTKRWLSDVDFSELYSVNLDEYVGLAPDHEQSYHAFMKAQLFDAKPFKESFLPDGMAEDLEQAAKDYDDILANHAIDLQILGIGSNGHIGFNEPGTPLIVKPMWST